MAVTYICIYIYIYILKLQEDHSSKENQKIKRIFSQRFVLPAWTRTLWNDSVGEMLCTVYCVLSVCTECA